MVIYSRFEFFSLTFKPATTELLISCIVLLEWVVTAKVSL